jgi:hypothetical protein
LIGQVLSSGRGHGRRGFRSRDPRPGPGRPHPLRPGGRAGGMGDLRLRQHDLLVRRRVECHGRVADGRVSIRGARRQLLLQPGGRRQRGPQRPRVADPGDDCRSCSSSPPCAWCRPH